jgi:5-methylcytosine-specific restriction endonuclease McrA
MSGNIPASLRQLVTERAKGKCEYCLTPQSASAFEHEPDHIIPTQHGGKTKADNLALACLRCNRRKGPNVGSFDPETGALVPFYNPRSQT